MRCGDKTYIKLENKKYSAIYLGKGLFSKAYVIQTDNGPWVITFGEDCIKEVLAMWGEKSNPHIPKIWRYDTNIYLMPYYRQLVPDYKVAWNQYVELRKIWMSMIFRRTDTEGDMIIGEFIRKCEKNKYIGGALINALQSIYDTIINCGSNILFEFTLRNLGVDNKGRLVLRDIAYTVGK